MTVTNTNVDLYPNDPKTMQFSHVVAFPGKVVSSRWEAFLYAIGLRRLLPFKKHVTLSMGVMTTTNKNAGSGLSLLLSDIKLVIDDEPS